MLSVLTVRGLAILNNGTGAPLWRALVTLDNAVWLNVIAALVVAACVTYAVRNFLFKLGHRHFDRLVGVRGKIVLALFGFSFFVIPGLVDEIAGLSPFFFSLMPSAIALALMASQIEAVDINLRSHHRETAAVRRRLYGRLYLSGVFAAIGTWEGALGACVAGVLLLLTFHPRVRLRRPVLMMLGLWFLGFLLGFAVEGFLLGWPRAAIRPIRPPFMGLAAFLFVAIGPIVLVRLWCTRRWLLISWGVLIAVLLTNVLVEGRYWRVSACERFTRKVLDDLQGRKIIIGDGLTDDFFARLKPADVRLVSQRSAEDREYMLNCFDGKEPLTKRALVVRQYYRLPEALEMMPELGYREKETASVRPNRRKNLTADEKAAARGLLATNQLIRALAVSEPVVKTVQDMQEAFEKIPPKQRRLKIEEARETIRQGWARGLEGVGLSSTILALDIMLGDWAEAESDALTALLIDRDDPAANGMMGNLRLRAQQFADAERYLEKAVKGGGSGAYNDMAMLLFLTGRVQEAESWARKAVAKAPKDWNCHETLAQILIARQEALEAQKELETAENLAKEQGQYEVIKESLRRDRVGILRLRGRFANEQWGQDGSDRWGE